MADGVFPDFVQQKGNVRASSPSDAQNHLQSGLVYVPPHPVLCVYLAGLAAYLVFACLRARTVKSPANEPKNLKLPDGYTPEEMQQFELEKLQERIDFNRQRNDRTARHLNIVRVMICASPVVFLMFIGFFWLLLAMLAGA